jgi:hypothetical protein
MTDLRYHVVDMALMAVASFLYTLNRNYVVRT